jgi:hypothetical protein
MSIGSSGPRVKLAATAAIVLLMGLGLIFGNLSPILKTASIIVGLAVMGMICGSPVHDRFHACQRKHLDLRMTWPYPCAAKWSV